MDVYDQNGEGRSSKFLEDSGTALENRFSAQIGKDIQRNGYSSWTKTSTYSVIQKEHDLTQIEKLLNLVFSKYPEFHYSQSMDSVFAAFYLLSNGNLFIAQKLIVQHLLMFRADITLHDDCVGDLKLLWPVLRRHDSKFAKWLLSVVGGSEEEVLPALKWYISWFTHSSITDFSLVLRMFEAMLSSQTPLVGLYMIIAVLLTNKEEIKEKVKGSGELVLFINTFHFDADLVDKAIAKCAEIVDGERKYKQKKEKRNRSRSRSRSVSGSPFSFRSGSGSGFTFGSKSGSGSGSGSDSGSESESGSGSKSSSKPSALWMGLKKATSKAIETVSSPRAAMTRGK